MSFNPNRRFEVEATIQVGGDLLIEQGEGNVFGWVTRSEQEAYRSLRILSTEDGLPDGGRATWRTSERMVVEVSQVLRFLRLADGRQCDDLEHDSSLTKLSTELLHPALFTREDDGSRFAEFVENDPCIGKYRAEVWTVAPPGFLEFESTGAAGVARNSRIEF